MPPSLPIPGQPVEHAALGYPEYPSHHRDLLSSKHRLDDGPTPFVTAGLRCRGLLLVALLSLQQKRSVSDRLATTHVLLQQLIRPEGRNPNRASEEDKRRPAQLLDFIEAKGPERLRALIA